MLSDRRTIPASSMDWKAVFAWASLSGGSRLALAKTSGPVVGIGSVTPCLMALLVSRPDQLRVVTPQPGDVWILWLHYRDRWNCPQGDRGKRQGGTGICLDEPPASDVDEKSRVA